MFPLLLAASLLLSLGGSQANVIMANEQLDILISAVTTALKESNSHTVPVVNKKTSFSKKILLVTISGSATLNGQLGDLSTLRRAGDAFLTYNACPALPCSGAQTPGLTLHGTFKANVGGSLRTSVSWNGIGVTGSVSVIMRDFTAYVRITHDIVSQISGASPQLREARLLSIGSLSVSIGGLGSLDWAVGSISSAMSGVITDVMSGWVGNQLASALRSSVSRISLRL